jgi:short subunit dehydrogenase-like uncharacterized protein
MSLSQSRELDIILVGATGYVGRLIAKHLATYAPAGLRVALAGRSTGRLEDVRTTLGAIAHDWALITVDLSDAAAVTALAARSQVVATAVGPYLRYGLPLVTACAEAGTDYADLTGETLFVRRSIDACHQRAEQTGARIVHACGFDAVPSDLGVGLTAARVQADGQGQLTDTVLHVRDARGGLSGGTIDSLRQQMIDLRSDPSLKTVVASPYALASPPGDRPRSSPRRRGPVDRDAHTGVWQAPFVMGGFNRQIVMRSDALAGSAYGPDFRYREVIDTIRGPVGAVMAAGVAAASTAVMGGMWFPLTRRLLDRVFPDPGEGPSEKVRQAGRFCVEVVAETTTGARYSTTVAADRDPAYDGTAIMIAESAIGLALPTDLPDRAGVLTPMTALGEGLAARLRERGFTVMTTRLA